MVLAGVFGQARTAVEQVVDLLPALAAGWRVKGGRPRRPPFRFGVSAG